MDKGQSGSCRGKEVRRGSGGGTITHHKVTTEILFFKKIVIKPKIRNKDRSKSIYFLPLNVNKQDKSYDDSVKLKRTEMDPIRLGLV